MNNLADDLFDNYCKLIDIISQIRNNKDTLFPNIDDRIKALENSKNLCDNYNELIDLLTKDEKKDDNQWEYVSVWQEERK